VVFWLKGAGLPVTGSRADDVSSEFPRYPRPNFAHRGPWQMSVPGGMVRSYYGQNASAPSSFPRGPPRARLRPWGREGPDRIRSSEIPRHLDPAVWRQRARKAVSGSDSAAAMCTGPWTNRCSDGTSARAAFAPRDGAKVTRPPSPYLPAPLRAGGSRADDERLCDLGGMSAACSLTSTYERITSSVVRGLANKETAEPLGMSPNIIRQTWPNGSRRSASAAHRAGVPRGERRRAGALRARPRHLAHQRQMMTTKASVGCRPGGRGR
jgi:hypothetical protein